MNEAQSELYKRIHSFPIDDQGSALPFSTRLATENGWTESYTGRVIEEYKKFIFLAVVCRHPVTPSDQVDQVWHLHLTYTRSWNRFCEEILKTELHHDRTRGGPEEDKRFLRQYLDTLETYRQHFNDEAPADIWPDEGVRFDDDTHFRRVNTKRNWIVSKQWFFRVAARVVTVAVICGVLVGIAAAKQDLSLAYGVSFFVILLVCLFILRGCVRNLFDYRRCRSCGRPWALRRTGQRTDPPEDQEEWRCIHCGQTAWMEVYRWFGGSGGGGGCGGGCG